MAQGGTFFPETVRRLYAEREATKDLAARELEALGLMANGLSNSEIAAAMDLSFDTVKTYLKGIYAKLGVGDRVSATIEGCRRGFLRREK